MKERYNTSKVFQQRKQLIWFHADTAVIFNQKNKTLNLQYHLTIPFTIPSTILQ